MSPRCWALLALLLGGATVSAGEETVVPSDPHTWYGDLRPLITPTGQCPGGTVEQVRRRMSVSEPHPVNASGVVRRFSLSTLRGVVDSDAVHEFYFRSDLSGDRFWGFGGYLISRDGGVIHTQVTTIDN
ncbi:hypothetical protein [Pseudoxanthomonas sp. PXM01]|uniref:hypothetical protein n=1 Tax=Pseudoxanthomonas sp. PXM01 TaxID=2769295 RepID=UPI00178148DD|nr:hypothetical protein [Pseudoxanthomonas sp. PXM01]MBD9470922.1 hypothetical protein [Pseudoxanthomonas sp. PXM01]